MQNWTSPHIPCVLQTWTPSYIIFNKHQVLLSSAMQYIYKRVDIKIKIISPWHIKTKKKHLRTASQMIAK